MTTMYLYFSSEKDSGWTAAPSDKRQLVIEEKKPKYITVLNVSQLVDDDLPAEEQAKLRYSGPFYADWDCDDLMDGAESVKRFLALLEEEHGVDPRCVRLYATGGRGYHVEVPFAVFSSAKSDAVTLLPYVWREIANDLYTTDMDMAVYSAKRGRMWRTPNVEREKAGHYKVPISYEELLDITPESYAQMCSGPRPYPELAEPELSVTLAAIFADRRAAVEKKMRERRAKGDQSEILARFKGGWPESVKRLMNGEAINTEVGLNKIALQLGILSSALGKTVDQHIEACEGLIAAYKGDGHSTRRAVRAELRRMFRYADGNPCYSYSPAAMAAILAPEEEATNDLRGRATAANGDLEDMGDLTFGMRPGDNGIYCQDGDRGLRRETNWHYSIDSVTEMIDPETNLSKGFSMLGMNAGQVQGPLNVDHGIFVSADKAKMFLASKGATAPRLDSTKAGGMLAVIMNSARANPKVMVLGKEGLNLVKEEGEEKLVWVSPNGCWGQNLKNNYRYRSTSGSEHGNYLSDITMAPKLRDLARAEEVLDALLNFNLNDFTVATVLGWLVSCWHKPIYTHWTDEQAFPMLQTYGESGGGKTSTCVLLMHLFYYRQQPKMMNASQGTAYGRRVMFCGSTTIPIYVDEFKPKHMAADQAREFRHMIHEMYHPLFQGPRGGGDARSSAPGQWAELNYEVKTTPMAFSTETAETETAIQERVVSAPFNKASREGRAEKAFDTISNNREVLSALGRVLLSGTVSVSRDALIEMIESSQRRAKESLARSGNSRPVYNVGVVLGGLVFLEKVLAKVMPEAFESRLKPRLAQLQTALLTPENYPTLQAMPELVKLLRFMSTISHLDRPDEDHIPRNNHDFAYVANGEHIDLDINVDSFYLRYRAACQRKNMQPLFTDADSFHMALRGSTTCLTDKPINSPISENLDIAATNPRLVRLSGKALENFDLGRLKA